MHVGKPVRNFDSIEIAAPPLKVFEYVTRPDLWHEWHPASTSAELPRIPLQVGDAFREIITVTLSPDQHKAADRVFSGAQRTR